MSFGFSVGDFITGVELVGTVISSLRSAGGSKAEFRGLLHELLALEKALIQVKQLETTAHGKNHAEYVALTQAACQCQHTIDEFWTKARKYQPHLGNASEASTSSRAKSAWMKVRWALCRSEDLAAFRVKIGAHTQSILILLTTLQMSELRTQDAVHADQLKSMNESFQETIKLSLQKLTSIASAVSQGVVQMRNLVENTAKILQTSFKIYHAVRLIHCSLAQLAPQIERQQPIYLTDALDRPTPFFLEFVRSAEALKAVLRLNFSKIPSGERKIHNGEFVLQDRATRRMIDLSGDWDACFLPGQRVEMSMVFKHTTRFRNSCPGCSTPCQTDADVGVECAACGLKFRRVTVVQDVHSEPTKSPSKSVTESHALVVSGPERHAKPRSQSRRLIAPKTAYDEVEDAKCYRRLIVLERRRRKMLHRARAISPVREQPRLMIGAAGHQATADDPPEGDAPVEDPSVFKDLQGLVNMDTFEQLLEMDDEVEREFSRAVVADFVDRAPRDLERLRGYIVDKDYHNMGHWAHVVKGGYGTLGCDAARDLAWELQAWEERCSEDDPAKVRDWAEQIYGRLEAEVRRLCVGLRAFYRMGDGS